MEEQPWRSQAPLKGVDIKSYFSTGIKKKKKTNAIEWRAHT